MRAIAALLVLRDGAGCRLLARGMKLVTRLERRLVRLECCRRRMLELVLREIEILDASDADAAWDGDSGCNARLGTRLLVALGIKTLKKNHFFQFFFK